MPTIERNDQPEGQTTNEKGLLSNEASNSSKAEAKPIKQSKKVAVKKTAVRKKAAKKAGDPTDSENKKKSQTTRKETQAEAPLVSDQGASVTGSEAGKAPAAGHKQPEKPAAGSESPAAAPPPGGTGLMGFWIKVGATAFVILAGIIGIYSFFSEDEAKSKPEATPAAAAAGDQGDDASATDSEFTDSETAPGVVLLPSTQQSNVIDPAPLPVYRSEPGASAGAAGANEPAVEAAVSADVTPGLTPPATQPAASRWDRATSIPRSSHFSEQPTKYRPELYRPLEPEQDAPRTSQAEAASGTPSTSAVQVPSHYPQPGAYTYPPAPYYRGYGYPQQPGAYAYPPAPYYGGYGRYYPY